MSFTKRHHFIPVFYLKHFTNDDGLFYIYDVHKGEFKNRGRKFAPSTHFYEHFGNTTYFGNNSSDFIEHSYTKFDNKVADIYKKIANKSIDGEYILTPYEWTMLQYFINILYWRNPSNRQAITHLIHNAKSLKDLRLKLMDQDTGERISGERELEFLNKIKEEPEFYKFYKSMLPGITYPEIFKKEDDFAHIFPFPFNLPKLVSDNPIIYRNPGKESLHTDEMIFVLTPTQALIRNKMSGLIIHSVVRILIDMMFVMQAKEYVSSTDLKYPITLREEYQKRFTSIDHLRETIFRYIFQKL